MNTKMKTKMNTLQIVKPIDLVEFIEAFNDYGRGYQFSKEARETLFYYYCELAESSGQPIELDVIGICCDWSELYIEDIPSYYDMSLEELDAHTVVLPVDEKRILVYNF